MPDAPLELWGGVECTVNRVGDRYFDQLERSGHATRASDLARFAGLGIRVLRYPVLWERTAPDGLDRADWSWADARLQEIDALGMRAIAGLVHHGSGPRHTSLLDPAFAFELAGFARAVAERYPQLDAYTPVNEPLTTARFSALYGHWYPHATSADAFARALLTECRATVLAMRAIREVSPSARLVQTEDLGKTHSTPALAYQAAFENDRRWVTFDLLTGRLAPGDRMWRYFTANGIRASELEWFRDNACPPDVIGVNYYLTSERFLDQRLRQYPRHTWGGNGRHSYADVEAVRARAEGCGGPELLLKEIWDRYRIPIAVTEVHNGCTREEQLRWFEEVWNAAAASRRTGIDVRAVTAWALLGSYDWNSLVTREDGHYEPGVFDIRGPAPRPTALAGLIRTLARGDQPAHPVLATQGWWRRPGRLTYGDPAPEPGRNLRVARNDASDAPRRPRTDPRPILITGAIGTLGSAFARLCDVRNLPHRLVTRGEMDIADPASVARALERHDPWAIVNAAGYVRVDDAERDVARCFRENRTGPEVLSAASAAAGIRLVTFSSDLVFDGASATPYGEHDAPAPLNIYGESKAAGERLVLAGSESALVVRTSAFFGPWDAHNFVTRTIAEVASGRTVTAASDMTVSPTYVPDLVHACLDLLIDGERGIWHLANEGSVTWLELGRAAARIAGLDEARVVGRTIAELGLEARRPRFSALGTERGRLLRPLDRALERYAVDAGIISAAPVDGEVMEA